MKNIMKRIIKNLKKMLLYLIVFLFAITVILNLTGNKYFFRAIGLTYLQGNTTSNISDAKDFDINTPIFVCLCVSTY